MTCQSTKSSPKCKSLPGASPPFWCRPFALLPRCFRVYSLRCLPQVNNYISHVTREEIFTLFEALAATNVALYRPEGGSSQAYLFKWEDDGRAEDWRAAGYRWRQGGSSSKSVNGIRVKKTQATSRCVFFVTSYCRMTMRYVNTRPTNLPLTYWQSCTGLSIAHIEGHVRKLTRTFSMTTWLLTYYSGGSQKHYKGAACLFSHQKSPPFHFTVSACRPTVVTMTSPGLPTSFNALRRNEGPNSLKKAKF